MLFRLFGPVEISLDRHRSLPVGPAQRCAVFAALADDVTRLVPVDTLIERVWGENPPPRARRTLHSHLTRIRRLLEETAGDVRVAHRAGGYLLDADPDQVDVHRFTRLSWLARQPNLPDHERVSLLRQALELWRGEPLTGVRGLWAERVRAVLAQHRVDATLALADAELRMGNAIAVTGQLADIVDRDPLNEPAAALMIRSLLQLGRTADALACYLAVRQRLADQLGIDPGAELQALYQNALRRTVRVGVKTLS